MGKLMGFQWSERILISAFFLTTNISSFKISFNDKLLKYNHIDFYMDIINSNYYNLILIN